MKTDDLENELRNLKFTHLSEDELAAYCDQELDPKHRLRAEAHLKQCFVCEQQLALLREESAALTYRQIDADDLALVERLLKPLQADRKPTESRPEEAAKDAATEVPVQERLTAYLRQLVANWQLAFQQPVMRGREEPGQEVWRWQSADGRLQAHAIMEKNADLTIHFAANDMALAGARLKISVGLMSQVITLRQVSASQVYAMVAVTWQQRQGNMANLAIEII
ncbi:MAG: hypothetical protein HY231_02695 [Acidobacteria bacterium]|nr:hypothetical protein [Acidobacteriota bacterium]